MYDETDDETDDDEIRSGSETEIRAAPRALQPLLGAPVHLRAEGQAREGQAREGRAQDRRQVTLDEIIAIGVATVAPVLLPYAVRLLAALARRENGAEFSAEVKAQIALHRPFLAIERDLVVEIS